MSEREERKYIKMQLLVLARQNNRYLGKPHSSRRRKRMMTKTKVIRIVTSKYWFGIVSKQFIQRANMVKECFDELTFSGEIWFEPFWPLWVKEK